MSVPADCAQYSTSINAVERDIRTLSLVAWTKKREDLEELAGHSLDRRPTSTHFLAILYAALISDEQLSARKRRGEYCAYFIHGEMPADGAAPAENR